MASPGRDRARPHQRASRTSASTPDAPPHQRGVRGRRRHSAWHQHQASARALGSLLQSARRGASRRQVEATQACAMERGRRTNQTPCTNLTTAVFADLVRAAQAARGGPPRLKRLAPESSPCRKRTKSRDPRWFVQRPRTGAEAARGLVATAAHQSEVEDPHAPPIRSLIVGAPEGRQGNFTSPARAGPWPDTTLTAAPERPAFRG